MDMNSMMATSGNRQRMNIYCQNLILKKYNWDSYNGLCTKYD